MRSGAPKPCRTSGTAIEPSSPVSNCDSMPASRRFWTLRSTAPSLALSACGNDVPTNGVAKIGDSVITKEQFNHWLGAAARGTVAPGQQATDRLSHKPTN